MSGRMQISFAISSLSCWHQSKKFDLSHEVENLMSAGYHVLFSGRSQWHIILLGAFGVIFVPLATKMHAGAVLMGSMFYLLWDALGISSKSKILHLRSTHIGWVFSEVARHQQSHRVQHVSLATSICAVVFTLYNSTAFCISLPQA